MTELFTPAETVLNHCITSIFTNPDYTGVQVSRHALARTDPDGSQLLRSLDQLGYECPPRDDLAGGLVRWRRLDLTWRSTRNRHVGGEIGLRYLGDVIPLGTPKGWAPELAAMGLLPFDRLERGGTGRTAALRLRTGHPAQLWFRDAAQARPVRLDCDLSGYITALCLTRGVYGWQYLFADIDLDDPRYAAMGDAITAGLEAVATAHPRDDLGVLWQRLASRSRSRRGSAPSAT
ncbi:hypothetical protein [Streptomyces sp. G-5]|uniref:hypothetical protein n=1 Tax=Streptomyces sp. G-5 TaxID=2977231 RepID=UPI0021D1EAB9|nr:hypothetical protein [Streptomyces sp. G-5]MCU4750245.1 hypothetical protein [Streptomyces sp. G-5]